MAIWRSLKRLLEFIGVSSDFDAFLKFIGLPAGLAGLTVYFAAAKEGVHWVIFLGTAVYAFSAAGIWLTVQVARSFRVFRSLHVEAVEPGHVGLGPNNSMNLIATVRIKNTSERDIHFRIIDGALSVAGRTNQEGRPAHGVKFLPLKTSGSISTPSVSGVPLGENIKGATRLVLRYGTSADDMPYELVFSAQLTISVSATVDVPGASGTFVFKADFDPIEHRKVVAE